MLAAAIPTGVLTSGGALSAETARQMTKVSFTVPPHACDCHTHIYGDPIQFPFSPERVYTPETATPDEMLAVHRALHIQRVVIVTPSVYGTDNSATLYGMKAHGSNARGIAVIGEQTSESELDRMERAGVRGVRINSATAGIRNPTMVGRRLQKTAERLKGRHWHIQLFTDLAVISGIMGTVQSSPVPVVFDHFGGAQASLGVEQPGFADLLKLVGSGKAYVKISGAYLASSQAPDYPDVAPLAKLLISANPDRVLWGSDWPHPDAAAASGHPPMKITPFRKIDDGRLLNQLAVWAPEPAVRQKILVENPARLYGF